VVKEKPHESTIHGASHFLARPTRFERATPAFGGRNLTDRELQGLAQLYANANAANHRDGLLLLIAANRVDGTRLARMSKAFGYAPVYDAIAKVAPTKAQDFAQHAAIVYPSPVAGASTPMMLSAQVTSETGRGRLTAGGTIVSPMQSFKPAVSMTFEQLYVGFRTLQVGSMAGTAALYETMVFAGKNLGIAYSSGYAVGTGLTWVAQTYMPDWYYGTFVDAVGNSVNWFQNTANTVGTLLGTSVYDLGHFELQTTPTMSVPSPAVELMETSGGDWQITSEMVDYSLGAGRHCQRGTGCYPIEVN
jgi:hypothetical protein